MCRHSNHTFPLTPKSGPLAGHTYVACLKCGAELEYDWTQMRIGKEIRPISERKVLLGPTAFDVHELNRPSPLDQAIGAWHFLG